MATTHTATRHGKTKGRSGAKSNALALLKSDHEKVAALLERFEKRKDRMEAAQKQDLAHEICTELTIHAQIEEEIFYPAVAAEIEDAGDLVEEARVEHASLKHLIGKIESGDPDTEAYDALMKVLGEYVKHHVKEEQSEMFPMVRKSDLDLAALGEQLMARKAELAPQHR
jgi:hypothetical protein